MNENILHLNETIRKVVTDHEPRIREVELKVNTHETRWKIAGPVLLVLFGSIVAVWFGG